jgi:diaminohydroxyphosphoribosylaminopyrimidine deaminase/5-amino-6-(5-phosphoribosylamino)uracil reductase
VIVAKDGRIVGRGWTARGGRPHAETRALAQAGAEARGATAFVTLEPCAHHGQTPPCAEALIASGISRVVAAISDPDPRVSGRGFATLAAAGIEVTRGVLKDEARALNAGFFSRIERGRPLVALKIAESADGFVAGTNPAQKWITSEEARRHGHRLRASFDAIMVGLGTVLADDPLLTCRIEGLEDRSPLRVVLDSRIRLPASSQLVRTARDVPVAVFTSATSGGDALRDEGVEIVTVEAAVDGRPDLAAVMRALADRGLTRVLVEGGPEVHRSLIAANLADLVFLYRAPHVLRAGTPSAFGAVKNRLHIIERADLGPDLLESFAVSS